MFLETKACGPRSLKVIFGKVEGHMKHVKESNLYISLYMKFTFRQKLIVNEHTQYLGQRSLRSFVRRQGHSVHVPCSRKNSYFNSLNRYLITYYHVSNMFTNVFQTMVTQGNS
jgi:hypothetical protein